MAIAPFLAMTAAEIYAASRLPPKTAWMACHFSPYGLGLSNLPQKLPPGSLLMIDDITPPHGHDPGFIAEQVTDCAEAFQCCGILLDFQRNGSEETRALAAHLVQALSCPVIVSEGYGEDLDCPIVLPPLLPSEPLEKYLSRWKDREIWLELGLEGEILTLTEEGCQVASLPCPASEPEGFSDEKLHCHYAIDIAEKSVSFTLWRTIKDFEPLLTEAEALGVTGAVGLYQELGRFAPPKSLPFVKGGGPPQGGSEGL